MSYQDIYNLRLNRYGLDYQTRTQTQREKMFSLYLLKSIYRISFKFEDRVYEGSFERYKQDETRTLHYLLTDIDLKIPNGTILEIAEKGQDLEHWMVYYLEEIQASGYNRYIMLKMTHYISWTAADKTTQESWAYMYGQEDNMLKDEFQGRSRMGAVYNENMKDSFFVMPRNEYIKKDTYIEVGEDPFMEAYRVVGYDIQSCPGVEYVTIDPVYRYDLTPAPEQQTGEADEDFFWLKRNTGYGS